MTETSWARISSHPTLDGNGVKAMSGQLIYLPNKSWFIYKKKEIEVAKWGTPKKVIQMMIRLTKLTDKLLTFIIV